MGDHEIWCFCTECPTKPSVGIWYYPNGNREEYEGIICIICEGVKQ